MVKGQRKEGLQDRLRWWNLGDSIEVRTQLGSNGFSIDGALVGASRSHKPQLSPFKNVQECSESFDNMFDVSCVTRTKSTLQDTL
jgi:hypothetical protein